MEEPTTKDQPKAEEGAKPSDYDLFGDDSSDDEGASKKQTKKGRLLKKAAAGDGKLKKSKKKKKRSMEEGDGDGLVPSEEVLSKREKMERLRASKKLKRMEGMDTKIPKKKKVEDGDGSKPVGEVGKDDPGYDSGDSYNSGTGTKVQRTAEDDDFLDMEGEDEDMVKEYFQEQKFHDERGEKKRVGNHSDEEDSGDEEGKEPENPIMAAVHRMKKIKRVEISRDERDDIGKDFVDRMRIAAEEDAESLKQRRPALKKISMLKEVESMLSKKDMQRPLLDGSLLFVAKSWIAPLSNGKLGNITVRQRLLECIGAMTGGYDGEEGVSARDLKESGFGKVIMSLYRHKMETPQMKRLHKSLIEQWSRPIFNKSNNMKDRERVDKHRAQAGVLLSHQLSRNLAAQAMNERDTEESGTGIEDMNTIFNRGFKSGGGIDLGNNRVRVPYSRGFQFTVRPEGNVDRSVQLKKAGRESLSKRLTEKKRSSKSSRGAGLSVEGRPVKG